MPLRQSSTSLRGVNTKKYQGLKEELKKWRAKAPVVPAVVGALGAVTPRLWEWLLQTPVTTGFW